MLSKVNVMVLTYQQEQSVNIGEIGKGLKIFFNL